MAERGGNEVNERRHAGQDQLHSAGRWARLDARGSPASLMRDYPLGVRYSEVAKESRRCRQHVHSQVAGMSHTQEGAAAMAVSADSLDRLSAKIDEAKRTITAAASQSEAELKAKVDEARKNADDDAAELSAKAQATGDQAKAHWQQIQSDWEQHRESVRRRIDEVKAAQDLEAAEMRAEWAENDARDAVDFAANAIDEAKYAMLDAILARKDVGVLLDASS